MYPQPYLTTYAEILKKIQTISSISILLTTSFNLLFQLWYHSCLILALMTNQRRRDEWTLTMTSLEEAQNVLETALLQLQSDDQRLGFKKKDFHLERSLIGKEESPMNCKWLAVKYLAKAARTERKY